MPRGIGPAMCNQIERTGVIPPECLFLNETLHFCPDWGAALIDSSDPEYERCCCNKGHSHGSHP